MTRPNPSSGLAVGTSDSFRIVMQVFAAIVILVASLGLMGQTRNKVLKNKYIDAVLSTMSGTSSKFIQDYPVCCIYNKEGCILR